MTAWGPATCSLGPGVIHAEVLRCALYDSGHVGAAVIRNVTGTLDQTYSGGFADAAWGCHVLSYDLSDNLISDADVAFGRVSQAELAFSFTPPLTTNRIVVQGVISAYVGQSISITASGTWDTLVYCALGTQMKGGIQGLTTLTPDLVQTILASGSFGWLGLSFFAALLFTRYNVANLCSGPPPQLTPLHLDSWDTGVEGLTNIFGAIAWDYFCECIPGSPAPVVYPPPASEPVPGWPSEPSFSCTNADICATLVGMQSQISRIQMSVNQSYELVTLLQRYKAPFAYILGVRHSGLSGEGSSALPRTVGLRIEVTDRGARFEDRGNPNYVWDLGWLALLDANGMIEEKRLTRDVQVWLPEHATDATAFTWSLLPDVTIAVTELYAEP